MEMPADDTTRSELLRGWERYPLSLQALYPQDDLDYYQRRITMDSTRLFDPNNTDIRFVTVPYRFASEGSTDAAELLSIRDNLTNETQLEKILIVRLLQLNRYLFLLTLIKEASFNPW